MCSDLRERDASVIFINVFPKIPSHLSERIVKERRCARHVSRCRRAPDAREDDDDDEDEEEESRCFEEPSSFRNTQTEGGFFFLCVRQRTQKKYARL